MISVSNSAPRAGAIDEAEALRQLPSLVADPSEEVAQATLGLVSFALKYLAGPSLPELQRYAIGLYRPLAERLGWEAVPGEPLPKAALRSAVLELLALEAEDPATRGEARDRGRKYLSGGALHPEAVAPDLATLALKVALQEDTGPLFAEALKVVLTLEDSGLRHRLLEALGSVRDPKRLEQALGFSLDPRLHKNERFSSLWPAFDEPRTREQAWIWLKANVDKLAPLIPTGQVAGMPWLVSGFCDEERRAEIAAFFKPRLPTSPGMERNLAQAEERIHLCAARRQAGAPSVQASFRTKATDSN